MHVMVPCASVLALCTFKYLYMYKSCKCRSSGGSFVCDRLLANVYGGYVHVYYMPTKSLMYYSHHDG